MIRDARRRSEKRKARREISERRGERERERGGKSIPTCALTIVGGATNANNQTHRNHKREEEEDKENNTKQSHTQKTRREKNKTQTNTTTSNSAYASSLRVMPGPDWWGFKFQKILKNENSRKKSKFSILKKRKQRRLWDEEALYESPVLKLG